MKKLIISCLFLLPSLVLTAQKGYQIDCKIKNIEATEIYMAYHLGSKQYLKDTAKLENGVFTFRGEEPLESGVYLIAIPPKNTYFEVLIDPQNQHFSLETESPDYNLHMKVQGSEDNQVFYGYIQYLGAQRKKAQELQEKLKAEGITDDEKKKYTDELEIINKNVSDHQTAVMEKPGNFFVSKLISANQDIQVPAAPEELDSADQVQFRYRYYKEHYFDNLDLGDDRMLRTPVLERKVMNYLDKMIAPVPDSITKEIDWMMEVANKGGATEVYRFLLSSFLNKYAASKVMGLDAVYVYIALKYYADPEKTPWVDPTARKEIVKNAKKVEPLLLGKVAPDLDLTTLGGQRTRLHNIKSKFTLVYFWDPDCGNCSKMSTKLVEVYKDYHEKGLEIFGICNKSYKEIAKCGEKEKEKGMNWINTADPYGQARAHDAYFINSNPTLYLLDERKEIILKRIDAEQVRSFLERELDGKGKS